MNLAQRDRKFLGRESPAEDVQVARTDGPFVFDSQGKKYVDFHSGWCVGNFGWARADIQHAMNRVRVDYVFPHYLYEPWVELAELLAEITPGNLQVSYRATGGTEAVDIALQIAMAYTKRKRFLSLEDCYHGNSIGTVSIGATEDREPYPNLLSNCAKFKGPMDAQAAARVERILQKRNVAALILEPVNCNLGVQVPDDEFMDGVSRACRRYGTLLILDEVATGFGRTGKLFAAEHYGLEPDIMCLAKAMTGGAAPIGATITTAKIANEIKGDTGFYSTYGWHPRSTAAAIANIRWLRRNGNKLLRHVDTISAHFAARLAKMKFESMRIKGAAMAVETGDKKRAERIVDRCRRNGLLVTTSEEAVVMFPPLVIDLQTADLGLDILEQSAK